MARRALTLAALAASVLLQAASPLAGGVTCAMGNEGTACCCEPSPGSTACAAEDLPGCCDVAPASPGTTPAAEAPRRADHGAGALLPASRIAAHGEAIAARPEPRPAPPAEGPPRYLLLQTFLI